MKKVFFILVMIVFFITGCKGNKVDLETFIDKATYSGYIIEENNKGYESYPYIKKIYYAVNRENAYDIQFLELESVDYAKKFFDINKKELESLKSSMSYVKQINLPSYQVYHLETSDKYRLVLRSNNSIIYINASIDYINEIEEFLEELDINY